MKRITACLTGILVIYFVSVAHANLVTNGSFESGIEISWFQQLDAVDTTSITGWSVLTGSIDYVPDVYWDAADGSRSIDLSGLGAVGPGLISQPLSTIVGEQYLVEFAMSGNAGAGPIIKSMQIGTGSAINSFFDVYSDIVTFDTSGRDYRNMGWIDKHYTFTATTTATYLQFFSLDNYTDCGPTLDNVRVNPVPEPTTMLLLGLGLMGVAVLKRKITK